jgi:hypothetical protein
MTQQRLGVTTLARRVESGAPKCICGYINTRQTPSVLDRSLRSGRRYYARLGNHVNSHILLRDVRPCGGAD